MASGEPGKSMDVPPSDNPWDPAPRPEGSEAQTDAAGSVETSGDAPLYAQGITDVDNVRRTAMAEFINVAPINHVAGIMDTPRYGGPLEAGVFAFCPNASECIRNNKAKFERVKNGKGIFEVHSSKAAGYARTPHMTVNHQKELVASWRKRSRDQKINIAGLHPENPVSDNQGLSYNVDPKIIQYATSGNKM